jgi:glycosyltransferase involved in cell wall biosynthesis
MPIAKSMPLVSIVVPVFNGERFLRESLDSIVGQTYSWLEILVMDDASTDKTPEIVASYGDRLQYHRQSYTRGIYGNANDGIALAQGEFIAVYHGDDVYHPEIVEREVAFLQRYPEAGAVFCSEIFMDVQGREFGRLTLPPAARGNRPLPYSIVLNSLLTYKNSLFCCPTSMVRAAVHCDVGVYRDEVFRNTSDLDMWLRIARKYNVGVLEEHLLCYRRGHGSSSERYHRLRTDPERFFTIMDLYLADGDRTLATQGALAAYEAHRAEDNLKRAASYYILDRRAEGQAVLRQVSPHRILASPRVRRGHVLVLFLLLQVILRMPRNSLVAERLRRRLYPDSPAARQTTVPHGPPGWAQQGLKG